MVGGNAFESPLDLSPIIIEIHHAVNPLFLKKAANYCQYTFKKHKADPVIPIVHLGTLHDYVAQYTTAGRFPEAYAFPSYPWAADSAILSKESPWQLWAHSFLLDCSSLIVFSLS